MTNQAKYLKKVLLFLGCTNMGVKPRVRTSINKGAFNGQSWREYGRASAHIDTPTNAQLEKLLGVDFLSAEDFPSLGFAIITR